MPTKRIIIGITGGIATGKTAVLQEMARHKIPTVSSDDLAHACLKRGHPCYARILRHFGLSIRGPGAQINRKRLGRIVFANPKERKWLENQIHPWVVRQLKAFIRKHRGLTVLDIPLLYEAHLEDLVDVCVVVWCPQRIQIARLRQRDGLSRPAALQRIRAQLPLTVKRKRADYVISNNQGITKLRRRVIRLLAQFLEKA